MKDNKQSMYFQNLKDNDVFKPPAFETLEGFDEKFVGFLKRIISILAQDKGKD